MPKSTKKQYVVTYFRKRDEIRSQQTGKQIPLRTTLVSASTPEDAYWLGKTDARTVISADPRGRGALKSPGYYIVPEKPSVETTDLFDTTPLSASDAADLEAAVEELENEEEAAPATRSYAYLATDEEAPFNVALTQTVADEAVVEIPDTATEEATVAVADLSAEDRAEFDRLGREALKANALAQIDRLISIDEEVFAYKEQELARLEAAGTRSLEIWNELGTEVHEIENRRLLRPIAIEALRDFTGSVPGAISEEDTTLEAAISDITREVVIHNSDLESRLVRIDQLNEDLDTLDTEIHALKFLRSEVTGEPFNEELEDDIDALAAEQSIPFATPETVDDETEETGKTAGIFLSLVSVVGSAVAAAYYHTKVTTAIFGVIAAAGASALIALLTKKAAPQESVVPAAEPIGDGFYDTFSEDEDEEDEYGFCDCEICVAERV